MSFERLQFGEVLARVDLEEAEAAVFRVADEGLIRYPVSERARSRFVDDVRMELPGLYRSSEVFDEVICDQGWSDDQVALLGTGFEMALIVLHEMVRESRRIG